MARLRRRMPSPDVAAGVGWLRNEAVRARGLADHIRADLRDPTETAAERERRARACVNRTGFTGDSRG
jgi:hypothetical protein